MSTHSAGPWRHSFKSSKTNNFGVYGSSGFLVASVDVHQLCPKDTMKRRTADARLIAAAPDLLAALRFIMAFYEPGQSCLDTNAWKQAESNARAAIAMAEGEQS